MSKYDDDLLKIFIEKNAALKRKALETKSFVDVMKFLYSINEIVSHYGGVKSIFKNSFRKHNPKVWSSLQSDIFAWFLMMVLKKQEENSKSWSLIFYEYLCDDKHQQFNIITPIMAQTFKDLLQGFKIHLPQDIHIEAESIIEYFELHQLDPYSATIGQRATKEVIQRSQQLSEQLIETMLEYEFASPDDRKKKKTQYKVKYIELLKKVTNISLIQDTGDTIHELHRFVSMLRGVHQLICGTLVIVNTEDENNKEGVWKFGRVARKSQGSLVLVYLDPRESIISSFPFSKVLPVCHDILLEFYMQDDPSQFETYIEHPENSLLLSILQHYTTEAKAFLSKMMIDMEIFQLALKNQSTIYHTDELKKISQALKKPPNDILEKTKNYAKRAIDEHLASRSASPPWAIFQPTKDIRKQELLGFKGDDMFKLELKNYHTICDNSIVQLNKRKELILMGVIKDEINDWWHKLIQSTVESYLSNQGYELTAVPHNYVDKPPENILDVQKNLQLLQRILQSFYHNVETFKLKDLIKSICTKIYANIQNYTREVKYCVCEIMKMKEFNAERILAALQKDNSLSDETKHRVKGLIDDNKYLHEMQEMEKMRPSDRGRLDIVPVSGLVLSVICRLENECRTVLDLWENKSYVKDEDSKSPLENAVLKQDIKAIESILKSGVGYINEQDAEGWTILHLSCSYWNYQSRLDVTKFLIENEEINVLITNNYGSSPLHFLVRMPIPDNEKPFYLSVLKLYLKNALAVHICDKKGESPLHVATLSGNALAVRELLLVSADPNCATVSGDTCLHYAVSSQQKDIVKLLLDHYANPKTKNSLGESPIDLTIKLNLPEIRLMMENSPWSNLYNEKAQSLSEGRVQSQLAIQNAKKLTPIWSSPLTSSPSTSSSEYKENTSKVEWKKAALPPELAAVLEKGKKSSDTKDDSDNDLEKSLFKKMKNAKQSLTSTPKTITTIFKNIYSSSVNNNSNHNNIIEREELDENNISLDKPAVPPRPTFVFQNTNEKHRIALYSFDGRKEEGELPFNANTIIKVVSEDPSGWWRGKSNGITGIFPVNYTKPYHPKPRPNQNLPSSSSSAPSSQIHTPSLNVPSPTRPANQPDISNNNPNGKGIVNNNPSPNNVRRGSLNNINTQPNNSNATNNLAIANNSSGNIARNKSPTNNLNNPNNLTNNPNNNSNSQLNSPLQKQNSVNNISSNPNNNNNNNAPGNNQRPNVDNKINQPVNSTNISNGPGSREPLNNIKKTQLQRTNSNPIIKDESVIQQRSLPKQGEPNKQPQAQTQAQPLRGLPKVPSVSIAVVMGDYSEPSDCLCLKKGEKVRVLNKKKDGWWLCQSIGANEIGLFPRTYLQLENNPLKGPNPNRNRPLPPIS